VVVHTVDWLACSSAILSLRWMRRDTSHKLAAIRSHRSTPSRKRPTFWRNEHDAGDAAAQADPVPDELVHKIL
jgi:hypothetical protein